MSMGRGIRSAALMLAMWIGVMSGVGAVGGGGVMAAPPGDGGRSAPTVSQQIVARVLEQISRAAKHACDGADEAAKRAVRAIAAAADRGATDEQIVQIGDNAKMRLMNQAAAARTRIEALRDAALTGLGNNGGTAEQIARVNAAAARALQRVQACVARAKAQIEAAVARATSDDDGGPGPG